MTLHRDAADRRRQVGEALMHVVARHGLAGTTLRQVADEAGVSVGLVQRYFTSKTELLQFGFEHVYERTRQRVAAVALAPPVRQILLDLAEAILPLDPERRRESRVWLAFVDASLQEQGLSRTHQRSALELVDGLRDALAGAQRTGELDTSVDIDTEALALAALMDGLTVNGLAMEGRYPPTVLRTLLHRHVDRLFTVVPG